MSENASFAEACEKAGVAFVGPPSNAIESMGDKIASKKIAAAAGVNTIPGFKVPLPAQGQGWCYHDFTSASNMSRGAADSFLGPWE